MRKAKSSKNKNTDKKEKTSGSLKALQADQQSLSSITNKSLFSLKKVKKQLDDLISERKNDHLLLKKLKKNSGIVTKQIQQTEEKFSSITEQSKNSTNKELQQLKNNFQKKNIQLTQASDKLAKEIVSLNNLVKRVDSKIVSLENESTPSDKVLRKTIKNNALLLTKVKQFEEQLNQFKDTIVNPGKEFKDFAIQLNKLQKTVKQSKKDHQEHDTQIKLLQSNVTNIRQLVQEDNNNIKNQHELIINTNKEVTHLSPAIDKLVQKYTGLNDKTHSITADIDKLRLKTNTWKQDLNAQLSKQPQAALASTRDITQQLSKQRQKIKQQFKDQNKKNKQNQQNIQDKISTLQEKHNNQTAPLKTHVRELKHTIETLQEGYNKQQKDIKNDAEQIYVLNNTINKFSEQLQQSHVQLEEELKNHIKLIQDTDKNENFLQFQDLKQKITIQSQQLEDSDKQLSKLNILFDTSDNNIEQLEQINDKLKTLTSSQDELSEHEDILQTSLSALTEQINNEYSAHKMQLDDIISEQESHLNSVEQLSETLTTRSQLFLVGLVSTIIIASLLFYHQDNANQSLAGSNSNNTDQKLIINKNNIQIDELVKQNNEFSQEFSELKNSIINIKNQYEEEQLLQYALQDKEQQQPQADYSDLEEELDLVAVDLDEKYEVLQYKQSLTQEEQGNIKQEIIKLSKHIESISTQISHLQYSSPISQAAFQSTAAIDIHSISHPYYAIQLMGAQEQESVVKFVQQHQLSQNMQTIITKFNNKPWYILVQGQYMSYANAKKDLEQLPEALQINNPWIKKLP